MMALAVAGILTSLAVPGLRTVILNARRDAAISDLLWSVQLARSESARRAGYVTLCPSADGASCSGSSGDWTTGWIVYENLDKSYSGVEPDPGEPVLRVFADPRAGTTISSGGRAAFTFRPFDLNSDNGTITLCDPRAADPRERRAVIISTTGRPRVSDRKSDGGNLDCP